MPELVKVHLRECDCLVLESNHDLDMLKVGPYPWVVKQRVLSRTGHLSNHAVSEFLADPEGFDSRARYLVLAHISQENNNPDLVRISAEEALRRRPAECAFTGEVLVASQHVPLRTLEL
jgi:phosphoribosyl 1,2-cyclic phosphodiesterase